MDDQPLLHRCVQCNAPADAPLVHLSRSEYALSNCTTCKGFVDPYVEHDRLLIFIDLLLAKKSVYRHLLYNQQADLTSHAKAKSLLKLTLIVLLANAYLVWSRQSSRYISLDAGNSLNLLTVLRSGSDAMLQSFQYLAVSQSTTYMLTGICTMLLLQALTSLSDHKPARLEPLLRAVLLSSITKLFFMALSLIWREALPLGTLPRLQVPTEDLILAATEFVSRSVALSVATNRSTFTTGLLSMLATAPMYAIPARARPLASPVE